GKSDGYFLLNSLNPSDQGIGSATGADGYLLSRGMVIGIQPNKGDSPEIPPLCLTYSGKKIENGKYTRSSYSNKFTNIPIHGRFSNTTTETKSFDFGFGIFDKNSGELLSTIYSAWFKDLETSSGATKDWMCNVPSTIPDGQYRVFPISRVRETPEWLKCHGAETNYYDIIISGDTLTLTSMGNVGYKDYQINSVTFNGTKQAGRAIEVAANVTNKGNCILSEIYLLVNGNSETISMCEVKPGETGDITMHFTPKDPGTYDISLSTDEDGKEILYTTSLTIGDALPGNISFSSIQVKDATSDKKINGNTFAITSTAKNNGQTPYNDVVVARLYRRVSSSSGTLSRTLPQEVSLAPGKSQIVEFAFKDLPTGEDFFATLAYYNMGTLVRYNSTSFHTILGNPAKFGDVNEDGIVDIADINVLINIILGSDKRVTPLADCNGDGIVDIADLNMVINEILK
ncbi:MAG: hypothetical protein KBT10_09335, partial [Bacteroidales bacterium]|nr:hypothetical protein [Candidatus Sodaliphilus aphodohippi]